VSDEDCVYFIERAEAEIALAQRAEHPNAVAAHYQLAEIYLDRVYGDGSEGEPSVRPKVS
jgi:hypothetical protein